VNYDELLKRQKLYNDKVIHDADILFPDQIELHTQQLALCAHAEISALVNATNFKKHHGGLESVDRDNILFESVDIIRYIMSIQNLWKISGEEFVDAFKAKDTYLHAKRKIDNNKWEGQPVAIIDVDDVLADFRQGFADWLKDFCNIDVNVHSEEYYFITDLAKVDQNPEKIFQTFLKSGGFGKLDILKGAKEFLQSLRDKGYWIQYLTARPSEKLRCLYDTFYWIDKFDLQYDAIDFSTEKFRWCAQSKYYDDNKIAFAIDDSPKHAEEYANHGIRVKVPRRSYNQKINADVDYYDTFEELLETI